MMPYIFKFRILFMFCWISLIVFNSHSQDVPGQQFENLRYVEKPDDPYIPVSKTNRSTSTPYTFTSSKFSVYQVNTNTAHRNIKGDAANEPSIAIDPRDPNRMVIAWRQFDTISSNFRQAGNAFSYDGGKTWNNRPPVEPNIFRSDPVLEVDDEGTFYFNSLRGDFACKVFKTNKQDNWDTGTDAFGGDKQWMTIDKTNGPGRNNIYASWSEYHGVCPPRSFTRSVDLGANYEECSQLPSEYFLRTLTTGINGEVFICGAKGNDFVVSRSNNAYNSSQDILWDFTTKVDLDGTIGYRYFPNPEGILGQVWIAVDHSSKITRGNVYLLSSIYRKNRVGQVDIMFARSIDGGLNWSAPVKINDDTDPDNVQWFGTLSVAPNGRIDVVWLDTRDNTGVYISSLYYSYSLDGGMSWSKNEKLSSSFDPEIGYPNQRKIGDYYHMISDDQGAHLAWAATFNGEQDVYYSYIKPDIQPSSTSNSGHDLTSIFLSQSLPNPFTESTRIDFTILHPGNISLDVLDALGHPIKSLIHEKKAAGNYSATWNGQDESGNQVSEGLYFYRMTLDHSQVIYRKVIAVR